jgi:tRNA(fMet)-specific endonuclease VapC
MRFMLDTSAYVGFKRDVLEVVNLIVTAERILFSPVVLGELMFGFRNGSKFAKNMRDLDAFLQDDVVELVEIGRLTSDRYSRIACNLKHKGTPIPTNDIWVAAQTMEFGAELITFDKHFQVIDGLVCSIFPVRENGM